MSDQTRLYDYILGGTNMTPKRIRARLIKTEAFRLMLSSRGGCIVEKSASRLGLIRLQVFATSLDELREFSDLVIEAVTPLAQEEGDSLRLDLVYPPAAGYKICGWVFYHPRDPKESKED